MSNEASTTKQKEATADEGNQKPVTPMVEALEEDDEFEEFASAAAWDEVKDGGVASVDDSAEWQVRIVIVTV